MISDKRPVQDFIQLLVQHGITHVIISPGSRNAPFSISLANDERFEVHSVIDERSAAFVAMGMAQQLDKPMVLICTSGTATLNYAPALAEAYYQRVPLIVVTADRPIEWIDQGEGQSIRQRDVYRNYVKASCEIAEEASDGDLVWYNVRLMDEAMRLANEGVRGPVHINFPLREPLYNMVERPERHIKMIERAEGNLTLSEREIQKLGQRIAEAKKVLILAGQMRKDDELHRAMAAFAERTNVVVFTEAHSNLSDSRFITTIDRLVMGFDETAQAELVPDLVITVGHNIISRKIKAYIRKGKCEHWHVDISGEGLDTLKHLTQVIAMTPADFFSVMNHTAGESAHSTYAKNLLSLHAESKDKAALFMRTAPWSDLKVFERIHAMLPAHSDLQMGNSSAVRYILLFDARADIRYFGNRGVAGIDGCTSTALGASHISKKTTTLVTGDIGFFYDSNAFWNNLHKEHLKVIVVNNGGGGIFRIIEGPHKAEHALETFFETTHTRSAAGLAAMYTIPFREASDVDSLEQGLDWLYGQAGCCILEVHTPRLENSPLLKAYFEFVRGGMNS
jgi:2-succinyl-5-enolpyruvyl-6-hydroxy-3-cyclohexene-1-carboxylate synthase